jgi:primosomal protein N' (replication factor Y) (superfamily II helicase)
MRVEVLVLRGAYSHAVNRPLYTYAVPEEFADAIAPGQLVAVPLGDRLAPGLVWGLDASDDVAVSAEEGASVPLRRLAAILIPEPLLAATHRALAEWLAEYYAAPLALAARLMVPPGLLAGLRAALRPVAEPSTATVVDASEQAGDEAMVLALVRARGGVEREVVEQALGRRTADHAIASLIARGLVRLDMELPAAVARKRSVRIIHLVGSPAQIEAWRAAARATLDSFPRSALKRPAWRADSAPARQAARQTERLLRQLAVLDALERPAPDRSAAGDVAGWRFEELRRLTRATESAVNELAEAGLVALETIQVRHDPLAGRRIEPSAPLPLTAPQTAALRAIVEALPAATGSTQDGAQGPVFLLHGITGSGKTEIYLPALAAVIARGHRGLVLVPEIALTPQAMARFAGRFPGRVALLHSGLTPAERVDEWRRIRASQVDIVVGSRSALFAPIERLGLIVVDEEHEAAYKQGRAPTYHARDVAVRLGALAGATVVLGSATPSIEAYWLAEQSAYRLIELRERAPASMPAGGADAAGPAFTVELPLVTLVDLRAELRAGNTSILSQALQSALHETLERGEQAILFLNRRGTASSVICRECGYVARCARCDVSMTFHASDRALLCHYCGRREPAPQTCPVCWSASIRYFGLGTERVESAVKRQFPQARVLRWDRDTARTRRAHEDLLHAFAGRRADVLVGTQMIAKGLDLPAVTLVGVVSADVALFLPDFRASERAFQLLTQVAGRAGRAHLPGRVLVQTFNPDHFCIEAAARHDYHAFFAAEVTARRRYGYPPFRRFVKFTYEHTDRYTAQVEAAVLAERLERVIRTLDASETDLVGPAPAFLERLRGRYRWQVILRSPNPPDALRLLTRDDLPAGWSVDVDPVSTL